MRFYSFVELLLLLGLHFYYIFWSWITGLISLIAANMIESKSFEVELKDAEPDIIEQLVEFAYTAR